MDPDLAAVLNGSANHTAAGGDEQFLMEPAQRDLSSLSISERKSAYAMAPG
jgi:hypothetical protein